MADLKLDTFIKVVLMTTSAQDGEALAAIRRANLLLQKANVTWEDLLRGKVTVVADPFDSITPPTNPTRSRSAPPPPPRPSFKCYTCDKTLIPSQFNRHGGQIYCSTCYANATTTPSVRCLDCNITVPSNATHSHGGRGPLCVRCYQHSFRRTQARCDDCRLQVTRTNLRNYNNLNLCTNCYQTHYTADAKAKARAQASTYAPRVKRKVTTADLMSDIFNIDPKKGP